MVARLHNYGITTQGYSFKEKLAIAKAAQLSGKKLATLDKFFGVSPETAFKATHGNTEHVWNPDAIFTGESEGNRGTANCETIGGTITCRYSAPSIANTIHEFAHVFDNYHGLEPSSKIPYGKRSTAGLNCHPGKSCVENTQTLGVVDAAEEFADFYLNWVLDGAPGFDNYGLKDVTNTAMYSIYTRRSWWNFNIIPLIP